MIANTIIITPILPHKSAIYLFEEVFLTYKHNLKFYFVHSKIKIQVFSSTTCLYAKTTTMLDTLISIRKKASMALTLTLNSLLVNILCDQMLDCYQFIDSVCTRGLKWSTRLKFVNFSSDRQKSPKQEVEMLSNVQMLLKSSFQNDLP